MSKTAPAQAALSLARRLGVLRVRDAMSAGIHPEVLRRLVAAGKLTKTGRGMYAAVSTDSSEHASLAHAAARVPSGVICLLSALAYTLVERRRMLALKGAPLANAQIPTLRNQLLKLAAVITRNTRRIRLYFASHWPSASIFQTALHALNSG